VSTYSTILQLLYLSASTVALVVVVVVVVVHTTILHVLATRSSK
jgi:hypothetical protein